ncbi:hypothetical protein EIN_206340, partial [Entamoeba invadens IP1]
MSLHRSVFIRRPLVEEAKNVYTIRTTNPQQQKSIEALEAKRESRNRDAAQQSFLIGVAKTMGMTVTLHRLLKKGTTSSQIFLVESIALNGRTLFSEKDLPVLQESSQDRKRRMVDCLTNDAFINILQETGKISFFERKGRTKDAEQNPLVLVDKNFLAMNLWTNLKFTRLSLVIVDNMRFLPIDILKEGLAI